MRILYFGFLEKIKILYFEFEKNENTIFWFQEDEFELSRFKKNVLLSSFARKLFIDIVIL